MLRTTGEMALEATAPPTKRSMSARHTKGDASSGEVQPSVPRILSNHPSTLETDAAECPWDPSETTDHLDQRRGPTPLEGST